MINEKNEVIIDREKNEKLFWKVFHNKYILYTILELVSIINLELAEQYNCVDQIYVGNIIKFKDITTLEWIVQHKHIELLKCKLVAKEYIDIERETLVTIIHGTANHKQNGRPSPLSIDECKQIFQLLLKYKSLELNEISILEIYMDECNFKKNKELIPFIKLILESLNSTIDFADIMKHICRHDNPMELLNILINSSNITITISDKFIDKSISLAFNSKYCNIEILQFILNDDRLYSNALPTMNKKFKSLDGLPINIESGKIIKIDLYEIFGSGIPIKIIEQLINLNYYKLDPIYNITQQEIDNCYTTLDNDNSNNNLAKEIHKLFVKKNNLFYSLYLFNYKEEIKEIVVLDKLRLECEIKLFEFCKENINRYQVSTLYTFIKWEHKNIGYFSSLPNLPTLRDIGRTLRSNDVKLFLLITGMDNNEHYEHLVSILTTIQPKLKYLFPVKWSIYLKELKKVFVYRRYSSYELRINSTGMIDWIAENYEITWFVILYESCKLIDYAYDKFKSIPKISLDLDYKSNKRLNLYPFFNALNNCDFEELDIISNRCDSVYQDSYTPVELEIQNLSSNITKCSKLTNYLISNGFKNFGNNLFAKYIKILVEVDIKYSNFNILDFDFSSNHNTLNHFNNDRIIEILISPFRLNLLQLILKYNINTDYDEISLSNTKNTSRGSFEDGIKCIELLLNQPNTSETQQKYLKKLINCQFGNLIVIRPIPIDRLKYIHQLIHTNNNLYPIRLLHSMYHIFHYFGLKSIKLQKYILQFPGDGYRDFMTNHDPYAHIETQDDNNEDNDGYHEYLYDQDYDHIEDHDHIIEPIPKSLDPYKISFKYIFESASFDELLNILVYNLSHSHINNPKYSHYCIQQFFNYNLEYFLDIKRNDLFFKELKYILQIGNNANHHDGFKSTEFEFSDKLVEKAYKSLSSESFKEFASFNSYHTFIKYLKKEDNSLSRDRSFSFRLNIINEIKTNDKSFPGLEEDKELFEIYSNEIIQINEQELNLRKFN